MFLSLSFLYFTPHSPPHLVFLSLLPLFHTSNTAVVGWFVPMNANQKSEVTMQSLFSYLYWLSTTTYFIFKTYDIYLMTQYLHTSLESYLPNKALVTCVASQVISLEPYFHLFAVVQDNASRRDLVLHSLTSA